MDQKRLHELLDYARETGVFTWRASKGRAKAGAVAGCKHPKGYLRITLDGVPYLAHRLAWLHVHGVFPDGEIDHKNGVRTENRINNLRDASTLINQQNQRRARTTNLTSGLLGVSARKNKWAARIRIGGNQRFIGSFDTKEKAHSAYVEAKRIHHAGCTI